MGEIKIQTRIILEVGPFRYFIEKEALEIGFISQSGSLIQIPLKEFDELVAFVSEHRNPAVETRTEIDTSDGRSVADVVNDPRTASEVNDVS